jgi:hypothetical protein
MFSPRGTYSASKRDRPEYLQTNAIITLLRASWVTIISFFDFDPRYIYIYHKWFASFEEAKKRSGGWRDNPYGMCDQRLHFNYALVEERRPRLLFGQPNPRPDHLFFSPAPDYYVRTTRFSSIIILSKSSSTLMYCLFFINNIDLK